MGESSLTIEYGESEYLSTAALPTLEALTGHVSCTNCLAGTSKAEDIEQQPQALLEEDYLSLVQEMAVNCDRRCAKWKETYKSIGRYRLTLIAGCSHSCCYSGLIVYIWTLRSSRCSCFVISVFTWPMSLHFTSFFVIGRQAGLSTCYPSAAERATRTAS